MVGPVNVKKFYAKCEKSLVSCMTSQTVSLDNLVGLVSFFGIFGFRGVNIPKVKNLGKCHDLERKCKMLIQEWAGGHFLVVLDVKKIRGIFGGFMGSTIEKYILNTSMCKENLNF